MRKLQKSIRTRDTSKENIEKAAHAAFSLKWHVEYWRRDDARREGDAEGDGQVRAALENGMMEVYLKNNPGLTEEEIVKSWRVDICYPGDLVHWIDILRSYC